MGIFSSPKLNYSQEEKAISIDQLDAIVSSVSISSLSQKEEKIVEEALHKRRGADGKISLRQIYEVLTQLEQTGKISVHDKKALLERFTQHLR